MTSSQEFATQLGRDMDRELLRFLMLSPQEREEQLEKDRIYMETRKVFVKTKNHGLACCPVNDTSVMYKVDSRHAMTDEVIPDAEFERWATGFDL